MFDFLVYYFIQLFLKNSKKYTITNVKHQYGSIILFLKTYLHNGTNRKKNPIQLKNILHTVRSNLVPNLIIVFIVLSLF